MGWVHDRGNGQGWVSGWRVGMYERTGSRLTGVAQVDRRAGVVDELAMHQHSVTIAVSSEHIVLIRGPPPLWS